MKLKLDEINDFKWFTEKELREKPAQMLADVVSLALKAIELARKRE